MNSKRSRLARKAARVEKNEFERKLDTELGALKRDRDKELAEASYAYKSGVAELRAVAQKASSEAWAAFQAGRDALVKKLAREEERAA